LQEGSCRRQCSVSFRERKTEEEGHDYQETSYGKFERTVTLPQAVETDKIAARCKHGVLEIRVPVPKQLAGRKIPIQIDQKDNQKLTTKRLNRRPAF
jgi:HSP20 family molecular chaperone IbpA